MICRIAIALAVCVVRTSVASAQVKDCTVAQSVTHVPDVRSAYTLVTSGMKPLGISQGIVVTTEDSRRDLVVGTLSGIDGHASPASVLVVVEGKQGVESSSQVRDSLGTEPLFFMDTFALQARVREQRAALQRTVAASQHKQASLKQVNEETEQLLKFERVMGGENLIPHSPAERARLEEVRAVLSQRFQAFKTQTAPLSFKKREGELTEQLNVMSKTLHARDQAIREGLAGVSPDLQQKIELIKATQGEHIDLLRRELAELRRERVRAESASVREPIPPQ